MRSVSRGMWRRGVLSALEEHQSVSELDVQMRPSIAGELKLPKKCKGLNGDGKMLYKETGGGRMKRRICGWRATTMGSAWGVEAPSCTMMMIAAAVATGATVCMAMQSWQ